MQKIIAEQYNSAVDAALDALERVREYVDECYELEDQIDAKELEKPTFEDVERMNKVTNEIDALLEDLRDLNTHYISNDRLDYRVEWSNDTYLGCYVTADAPVFLDDDVKCTVIVDARGQLSEETNWSDLDARDAPDGCFYNFHSNFILAQISEVGHSVDWREEFDAINAFNSHFSMRPNFLIYNSDNKPVGSAGMVPYPCGRVLFQIIAAALVESERGKSLARDTLNEWIQTAKESFLLIVTDERVSESGRAATRWMIEQQARDLEDAIIIAGLQIDFLFDYLERKFNADSEEIRETLGALEGSEYAELLNWKNNY